MNSSSVGQPASRNLSLGGGFIGVLLSPKTTFEAVVAAPQWLAMLLIVTVASAALAGGFYATSVGQRAYIEKSGQASALLGREANDQQQRMAERIAHYMPYVVGIGTLIGAPLVSLAIAGLVFLVGSAVGGLVKFKQVFAVVVYANVVSLVGPLVTTPLKSRAGVA